MAEHDQPTLARFRLWPAGLYLAFAALIWVDFARANPDGFANVGLILAVLPISLLGIALTIFADKPDFPFIPDCCGYVTDHALFYVPASPSSPAPFCGSPAVVDAAYGASSPERYRNAHECRGHHGPDDQSSHGPSLLS